MRQRGKVYWEWASSDLHFRSLDQRLSCGGLVNVQARLSRDCKTQLFFGIYGENGVLLLEEHYPDCRELSMTIAMLWALERAQGWIEQNPLNSRSGPA